MLNSIPRKTAIEIGKEINTEGHSPLEVLTEDGDVYFVKNAKGRSPDFYILNEFICHYLITIWGIPTPDIAIVDVDTGLIEQNRFTNSHKPFYYNLPVFGSKKVDNSFDMNHFFSIGSKHDYNKIHNPLDILKIGLFDIWVENTDRKPTNNNILLQSTNKHIKVIALDHAFAFDSIGYNELNPKYISNTWNENILETNIAKEIYKIAIRKIDWINEVRKYYYICIRNCEQSFQQLVRQIPVEFGLNNELIESLKNFLFHEERNNLVLEDYIARLKQ